MFELRLQESGYAELQLAFQLVELELTDWRPEFEKIEPEFTVVIQTRFEQEGPGWAELTKVYATEKAKRYPGKTILRRTDNLFHSFEKGNAENIARIEPLSAEFGSSVSYGIFHQETRPIIQVGMDDEERMMGIVFSAKHDKIRELGFDVGWRAN